MEATPKAKDAIAKDPAPRPRRSPIRPRLQRFQAANRRSRLRPLLAAKPLVPQAAQAASHNRPCLDGNYGGQKA